MKKSTLLIMTLAIASVAVIMFACKKENEPQTDNFNPNPPETQAVIDHVNAFKSRIEYYKANPAVKDGETESIDDAIYDIEALFNFTYAYPELSYSRTISYDTTLFLPVSNGRVLMTDLTLFYGRMYEAISELYHSAELSNKQFLILDVEAGELHGNMLSVNLHTVQGSVRGEPTPPSPPQIPIGPFEDGEWWWYGENQGGCNDDESDAAQQLSYWLNYYLTTPPEGIVYVYTDVIEITNTTKYLYHNSFLNEGTYCEFYDSNEDDGELQFILQSDCLNFHFFGEWHLIKNVLPNINGIANNFDVSNVSIEDYHDSKNYTAIGHHTTVKYAQRYSIYNQDVSKQILTR